MSWFFIALIAPFLWSLLNHADKYLVTKFKDEHTGVGALVIYSSMFALVTLPIVYFISKGGVYTTNPLDALMLICSGVLIGAGIIFYMYALELEDASYVVPFWQLIPVISYFLGVVFLNEFLEGSKLLGGLITIFGALILSLEFEQDHRFKLRPAILMLLSSLFFSLSYVLFKDSIDNSDFWASIFWNQLGTGAFGIALFLFVKEYRKDFYIVLRKGKGTILAVNVFGEIIQTIAGIVNNFAILLAPMALVLLASYTFQPLIVFIEGLILTILFPRIFKEKLSKRDILQKIVSMIIMGIGVFMIL